MNLKESVLEVLKKDDKQTSHELANKCKVPIEAIHTCIYLLRKAGHNIQSKDRKYFMDIQENISKQTGDIAKRSSFEVLEKLKEGPLSKEELMSKLGMSSQSVINFIHTLRNRYDENIKLHWRDRKYYLNSQTKESDKINNNVSSFKEGIPGIPSQDIIKEMSAILQEELKHLHAINAMIDAYKNVKGQFAL